MATKRHEQRFYRNLLQSDDMVTFRVVVKETDLYIHAGKDLEKKAKELVLQYRGYIESYIDKYPKFASTLEPLDITETVPLIILDMAQAGESAGVGPMAAVAGAIAEHVGKDLLAHSPDVIVENGGDVFLKTTKRVTMGIYAGSSPLSLRVGLVVGGRSDPVSVCTSSGTVGHSYSMGQADAVCVISKNGALADAAATATGNRVRSKSDIHKAIKYGSNINGVDGLVVIMDEQIGLWGNVELVPLHRDR
jgi:ApbE superfamily uncharacterized protein (UPF0280 family)